jgi:hypothetical protein
LGVVKGVGRTRQLLRALPGPAGPGAGQSL